MIWNSFHFKSLNNYTRTEVIRILRFLRRTGGFSQSMRLDCGHELDGSRSFGKERLSKEKEKENEKG